MILGDAVSKLKTFVRILNHISRSITWSLFILKASYLVNMFFHIVVSVYRLAKILKLTPVPLWISERPIDQRETTVGVFLDVSKAFDTLDHQILFTKLEHYGIRDVALQWIKSYFSCRRQFVQINQTCSSTQTIKCGVPQGSILGPLFFILYINDLPRAFSSFVFHWCTSAVSSSRSKSQAWRHFVSEENTPRGLVTRQTLNAISAADIAFTMASSQAIVNWLNDLDQSDFS